MARYSRDQLVDKMGRYMTQALFYETRSEGYQALFTLKDYDHTVNGTTYISLKQIYLEVADPTEYRFAMEVFGQWNHWLTILNSPVIMEHIVKWREELEVKLASMAINAMIDVAVKEGAKGTAAAKYVAERGWTSSPKAKKDDQKNKQIEDSISASIKDDLQRLGIH